MELDKYSEFLEDLSDKIITEDNSDFKKYQKKFIDIYKHSRDSNHPTTRTAAIISDSLGKNLMIANNSYPTNEKEYIEYALGPLF